WFYAARVLKPGGLVFIDDLDLMACFIAARYMHRDWNWELVHEEGNLAVFRKLADYTQPHDYWAAQPISQTKVEDVESFLAGFWPDAASRPAARPAGDDVLAPSIMRDDAPWNALELPYCDVPGMITDEEARYFLWVGRY